MSIRQYSICTLKELLEDYLGIPTNDYKTKDDYVDNYLYAQQLSRNQNAINLPRARVIPSVAADGTYLGSSSLRGIKFFPD